MLCLFRLVLNRKAGRGLPVSSRSELFEKVWGIDVTLSDAEQGTSGPLNRGAIADVP